MPPRALGSEPRPAPSLPAPDPSACRPLPGPLPLPMPGPPPLPPRPLFALPVGDMAMAPGSDEFGRPTFVPGWLEITTPLPAVFPPAFAGGANGEPRSSCAPAPFPLLPRPLPERDLPPPRLGGGGTTVAEPSSDPADRLADFPEPPAFDALPSMLAGGGMTCGVSVAALDLDNEPPPLADGGGGTGLARRSPAAVAPQLLRSRLTCDGGGATTTGAGKVSLCVEETSR